MHSRARVFIIVLVVLTSACLMLAGCSNRQGQGEDTETAAAKKEISIAMTGQYPPFNFFDEENTLVGFDVDISREIADRLGRTPRFVTTAWDGIIAGLLAKKYDLIIGSMAITEERKESVAFSAPYYVSGAQLFTRPDSGISDKSDLGGKTVGVTLGTTYEAAVRKIKGLKKVVTYKGPPTMYMELDNGRLDAFVTDKLVGLYGVKQSGHDFVLAGPPLYREEMGIALRQDEQELLDDVNRALEDMKADGTYAEISKKWFGRNILEAAD